MITSKVSMWDLFPQPLFNEMVREGYVNIQRNGYLEIANYSNKTQYEQKWNEVTLNCRGLIYDIRTKIVIARGFKKFFNWDDSTQPYPPSGTCIRMPKMDGSLGILYPCWDYPNEGYHIATRGSFGSDQAKEATKMFDEVYGSEFFRNDDGFDTTKYSYLFEIIYPENRIVVDYGSERKLVLLDVLETATGKSDLAAFDETPWPHKVEKLLLKGFADTMASEIPDGEEGFVFYWPSKDFRVKMKSAEYLEIHKLVFGLNARVVWERLGKGETWQEICEKIPDEFHPWVRNLNNSLYQQQRDIIVEVGRQWASVLSLLPKEFTRKEFAEKAVRFPLKQYLFMFYDNKSIANEVWNTLKPSGVDKITTLSEDTA